MENCFKQNSKYKNMKNYFVTVIVASALTLRRHGLAIPGEILAIRFFLHKS